MKKIIFGALLLFSLSYGTIHALPEATIPSGKWVLAYDANSDWIVSLNEDNTANMLADGFDLSGVWVLKDKDLEIDLTYHSSDIIYHYILTCKIDESRPSYAMNVLLTDSLGYRGTIADSVSFKKVQ